MPLKLEGILRLPSDDPDFFLWIKFAAGFPFDLSDDRFWTSIGFRFHLPLLSMALLYPKTVSYLFLMSVHFPLKRYIAFVRMFLTKNFIPWGRKAAYSL